MLVGISFGRLGTTEMDRVLVARNDRVSRWVLPPPSTFEAELVFVVGESGRDVCGEELRRDLTDHAVQSSADVSIPWSRKLLTPAAGAFKGEVHGTAPDRPCAMPNSVRHGDHVAGK